jgi:hypothetical protein
LTGKFEKGIMPGADNNAKRFDCMSFFCFQAFSSWHSRAGLAGQSWTYVQTNGV